MPASRVSRLFVINALALTALLIGGGCGNDNPPTGTSVVIDPVQAKEQGKGTADYYKAHPEAIQRDTGRRR